MLSKKETELLDALEPRAASEGVEIEGLPGLSLPDGTRGSSDGRIATLIADGLIDGACALSGRVVLTLRGRLLADYVTREIMGY